MARNPVMFVVEIGSVLADRRLDFVDSPTRSVFAGLVAAWLWFTVLFANFAEAVAEGRGKAQADDAAARPARRRSRTGAGPTARSRRSRARQLARRRRVRRRRPAS